MENISHTRDFLVGVRDAVGGAGMLGGDGGGGLCIELRGHAGAGYGAIPLAHPHNQLSSTLMLKKKKKKKRKGDSKKVGEKQFKMQKGEG